MCLSEYVDEKNCNHFQFGTLVRKYREHLFPMGDSHTCDKHSSMFAGLVNSALRATAEELEAVVRDPENDIVL